eukprot:1180844-Prorocentrum_minimum.AAC.2
MSYDRQKGVLLAISGDISWVHCSCQLSLRTHRNGALGSVPGSAKVVVSEASWAVYDLNTQLDTTIPAHV